jgi:predicted membrane protein
MKKANKIVWGIVLIAAGLLFGINALGLAQVDIFFDGWWTLLIIIPCAVGLFTDSDKTGNIIGLIIGVLLFLCARDIMSFGLLMKLIFPAIIIVAGLKLIMSGVLSNKAGEIITAVKKNGSAPKSGFAIFGGQDVSFDGEVFESAELTAIFGGIECDLRRAVIEQDCAINVCTVFDGIDLLVPDNVNVKISATSIFGGSSNKKTSQKDAPTLYINGLCMFGGVEVK